MEYKIKTYTHKVKAVIADDFPKVVAYWKSDFVKKFIPEGINITFDIAETDVLKQDAPMKLFTPNDGKCDVVMYTYDRATFQMDTFGLAWNHSKTLRCIYLATTVLDDSVDYTWKSMCHEILHTLVFKLSMDKNVYIPNLLDNSLPTPYYKNEDLYAPDGNFAQQLGALKQFFPQSGYKWFSPTEVAKWKLKPELWQALDKMREIASTPFIITSGLRTPQENINAGGKPNSAHLRGIAVDIACSDNLKRTMMVKGVLNCGIPVFLEIAQKHIHIDLDSSIHQMGMTIISDDE